MQKLLYTPDEIEAARIIPYCAEEIRRLVRRGDIPAVRRQGRRILIHYRDLEAYAERFSLSHTEPIAGPHASKKGGKACREDKRKASTRIVNTLG